jgi:hypothetical protein
MTSCQQCCRWISRLTIAVLAMLGLMIGIACATAGEESAPAPAKPDSLTIEKTRQATRRLGEVAIRMAPKGALSMNMNSNDVRLAAPDSSRSLQPDLAEFAQLLNEGAAPSAVRIAGFEPAGQRSLSNGLTLMTSGNPGHVVPPDSSGYRLYEYLKINRLDDAIHLLAAHGPLTEKDVTAFKTAFLTAAADLRQLDATRMLQLLSPDASAEMKQEFDAVSRLRSSLARLHTVAAEKSLVLPAGLEPDAWPYHFFGLATVQSTFESDGRAVWVSLGPSLYWSFEKHLDRWKPFLSQGYAGMCDNYSQLADSLRTGIATGAITGANLQAQITTLWQRIVTP